MTVCHVPPEHCVRGDCPETACRRGLSRFRCEHAKRLLALALLGIAGCSAAHAGDDAGLVDAGATPACSPCRAMNEEACRADLRCEAVPRWGNSIMPCPVDERGFSCVWVGCREAGMSEICPSLEDVVACAECSVESLPIDERGCRPCGPCESGFVDDVAICAVENLCAEVPDAAACS